MKNLMDYLYEKYENKDNDTVLKEIHNRATKAVIPEIVDDLEFLPVLKIFSLFCKLYLESNKVIGPIYLGSGIGLRFQNGDIVSLLDQPTTTQMANSPAFPVTSINRQQIPHEQVQSVSIEIF